MEITAKLVKHFSEPFGKEGKQKTVIVLDTTAKQEYPQQLALTLMGKTQENYLKNQPKYGDNLTVSFDVKSREWNGKYFTEAVAWNVKVENSQPVQQPKRQLLPANADLPPIANGGIDDSDLPF